MYCMCVDKVCVRGRGREGGEREVTERFKVLLEVFGQSDGACVAN